MDEAAKSAALKELRALLGNYLNAVSAYDTPGRVAARTELIFTTLYDDEPSEPDQAIRDVLTDLMHVSATRGIDFEEALRGASRMWLMEREEWGLDDD